MPMFSIELHIRDIFLLKEIQSFFGVGNIYYRNRNGTNHAVYHVSTLKDLNEKIIPHFINYPLLTKKRKEFELFKEIIIFMINKKHLTLDGITKIINRKKFMKNGLSDLLKNSFNIETTLDNNIQTINKRNNPISIPDPQ
jgi:hypothetical protein